MRGGVGGVLAAGARCLLVLGPLCRRLETLSRKHGKRVVFGPADRLRGWRPANSPGWCVIDGSLCPATADGDCQPDRLRASLESR